MSTKSVTVGGYSIQNFCAAFLSNTSENFPSPFHVANFTSPSIGMIQPVSIHKSRMNHDVPAKKEGFAPTHDKNPNANPAKARKRSTNGHADSSNRKTVSLVDTPYSHHLGSSEGSPLCAYRQRARSCLDRKSATRSFNLPLLMVNRRRRVPVVTSIANEITNRTAIDTNIEVTPSACKQATNMKQAKEK